MNSAIITDTPEKQRILEKNKLKSKKEENTEYDQKNL